MNQPQSHRRGRGVFVAKGLNDRSPSPQSLRRDRSGSSRKVEGFGCAVVCEGDLAVYCLGKVRKSVPSRQGRYDLASRVSICHTKPHQNRRDQTVSMRRTRFSLRILGSGDCP